MTKKLFPYKQGSASCKALAEALGIKRVKLQGGRWKGREGDILINWGSSKDQVVEVAGRARILNPPHKLRISGDKLKTFDTFSLHNGIEGQPNKVEFPNYTRDKAVAEGWIREGKKVVCRTTLTGHSGQGIVIAESVDQLVQAPLYVQYIPKKDEYRVHVMNGEVFFVQRKARKLDVPDENVNWQVRNLDGGFIYANQDVQAPEAVKTQAKNAIMALGLDFGAVDVVVTARGKVNVLEVNSACGLAGTTLNKYVEGFSQYQ